MALSSERRRYAGHSVCNGFGHLMRHPLIDALRRRQRDLPYLRVLAPVEDHQERVFKPADVDFLYGSDSGVDLRERHVALFQLRYLPFLRMRPGDQYPGSIPAHAGEPDPAPDPISERRVYPRACGGTRSSPRRPS